MRISSNMMRYNFLHSLNNSMETQNKLQEQLADGKALHRPSDDPVKTVRDLTFKTSQALNEQYTQNLKDAQSWMENTDGVMSDLSSVMIKMKELVVSADDTKSTTDLNTIGTQIDELINQVVQLGNTKVGNRYLFAGQNDSTQPFVRTTIKDPNSELTREVVIYNGDNRKISMPIQAGAINPTQDSVNLTGTEVFGQEETVFGRKTLSVLNHLLDIKNELKKTSSVSQTQSAAGVGTITGTYTGEGYKSFDVRIDNVASGQVTQASYSTDGGNTWKAVAAADLTAGDPTKVSLGEGITFSIASSSKNAVGGVYSFRVPQAEFNITKSNSDAVATIGGVYSAGSTQTPYTVRITSVAADGSITGAEYSTTGGTAEPVYDSSGQLIKSDNNWTAATITTDNTTTPPRSVVALPNGVTLDIDINSKNTVSDTYSFSLPQGEGPSAQWLSDIATKYVTDDHNLQLKAQTNLGSRMSMYEMAYNMLQNQGTVIESDIANTEDINMAQAITDFNTAQNIYRSALAVGGKIMPTSLVDFLT